MSDITKEQMREYYQTALKMEKVKDKKNSMKNSDLKKRILDISYKHKLAHLGSCLTAVDIIDDIFRQKKQDDPFILSAGHAGLALYVVLEKYNHPDYGKTAEEMYLHHGIHPDRCSSCGIDVSTGSLGQGLPIATGMAFGLSGRANVYCLVSDGECAEGSIWEALTVAKKYDLQNLKVHVNMNGWGAYDETDISDLEPRLNWYDFVEVHHTQFEFPFLKGQEAHYHIMNEQEYKEAIALCKNT